MDDKKRIDMDIADTIIERPYSFTLNGKRFYLYPVTYGKLCLLQRIVEQLEINLEYVKANPYVESIRIATDKREEAISYVVYHTFRTKKEVFDVPAVQERVKYFKENISAEDLATLLVRLLSSNKEEFFMQHLGITTELQRLSKALKAKDSSNTFTFGGVSVYGSLLDQACERYKWTLDYVVWGISFANLQLMISDKVQSLYLSKDEIKKAHISTDNVVIKADSSDAWEKIKQLDWD